MLARTLVAIAAVTVVTSAVAQIEYVANVTRDNGKLGSPNDAAGRIVEVNASWKPQQERLSFDVLTEGKTDGFWLVLSPGDNPKGDDGELAIFYFDRGIQSGTPTLSAYAYNGQNKANSFNTPGDFIVSTLDGSGWDAQLTVDIGPNGHRLGFDIDASVIQSHNPARSGSEPWTGAAFGERVGFWLHTLDDGSDLASYNNSGQLNNFRSGVTQGWYYSANITTTTIPAPGVVAEGLGAL
ncbi:MAG: hypothetical protein AAF747_12070, partial [Planctomycetota bacterium]